MSPDFDPFKPEKPPIFSGFWCLLFGILHFVGTFAIVGLHFMAGMASFTESVSGEIAFWKALQWVWTPLAMAAWNPENLNNQNQLVGLAFLWSCIIGFVLGFVAPLIGRLFGRGNKEPREPTQPGRYDY